MRIRYLLLSVLLTACASLQDRTEKPLVVATFYPLAYIAEQVGGDDIDVVQITPGGIEPHEYEPTPKELVTVHNADVFLMNGAGVDAWADKVIDELKKSGITVVRMIDRVSVMAGFNEEGELDPLHPLSENADIQDPHIWLDLGKMQEMAQLTEETLILKDPVNADVYKKNADALIARLAALDAEYRQALSRCALHEVIVSHNAFRYMGKRYGFETLAITGLSPEEEPSPKRIAEIAAFAKAHNAHFIFFETLISPKLAETVANEIGAQTLILNPVEGITPEEVQKGVTYIDLMEQNLHGLRQALQCQ